MDSEAKGEHLWLIGRVVKVEFFRSFTWLAIQKTLQSHSSITTVT